MITSLNSMTDEQIASAVADIIAGLGGTNERDFVMASEQYNSTFFKDMPVQFVKAACSALRDFFPNNINNFWVKKAENEFV